MRTRTYRPQLTGRARLRRRRLGWKSGAEGVSNLRRVQRLLPFAGEVAGQWGLTHLQPHVYRKFSGVSAGPDKTQFVVVAFFEPTLFQLLPVGFVVIFGYRQNRPFAGIVHFQKVHDALLRPERVSRTRHPGS